LAAGKRIYPRMSFMIVLILFGVSFLFALTSPEDFLGHRVGADRKLARYDKVISYLEKLSGESGRVHYMTVGKSTRGKDLALVIVSTEENMGNIDNYRSISRRLTDPRKLSESEAMSLAAQAKVFLLLLCNQHSSEIASSNMVMELAYDLARGSDPEVEKALQDVFVMIVPSANPDGQTMIVDYYDKYAGTEYEGGGLPWLYHHYAGHDINRDWFFLNLAETDALVDVMYRDWFPQVMVDVHQMGMTGVRMFVPPFYDPPNPNNHYLIWNQIELLGAYMKYRLAEAGKKGVINNAYYSGWYQGSVRPNATQHHITALLTESASVQIASPIFVDPAELQGTQKGLPEYGMKMNFTDPWPGGWWRLRDIVEYQLVAFKAMVQACSNSRLQLMRNFYRMAAETLDLPEQGAPYAYLVHPNQHDPGSTARMLKIFERTACEIHRAERPFTTGSRIWPEGTIVLKVGQPYGRFVKDLLESKLYPDLRKYPGGPPMPPYDNAAWTVSLLMGVDVTEVRESFDAELELLDRAPLPPIFVGGTPALLDCRDNNSYCAVNMLLPRAARVYRYHRPVEIEGESFPQGCFLVEAQASLLKRVAKAAAVSFRQLGAVPDAGKRLIRPGKVGVYCGWVASMDEGWTRLVLDLFDFNHERLDNERVRKGKLLEEYSVIILPSLGADAIVKGHEGIGWPPEYRGGIGQEGVENLKEFVSRGGTLIALREACRLVVREFEIPVYEEERTGEDFYCPGSLIRLEVDNTHSLGYGMPEKTAGFYSDGVILGTKLPLAGGPDRRVVARYGSKDILLSGWIIGEKNICGKPAVVDVSLGKGNVVLCGIGVQNRAQSWATFKLLFNAIFRGFK